MQVRFSFLAALLLTATALAGCSGGDAGGADATGPPADDQTTGTVEGIVVDAELLNVAGAAVAIPPAGVETTTGDDGRFLLEGVSAGSHTLFVNKLGYEAETKRIDVVAGQTTEVEVTLTAIAVQDPYADVVPFAGYFECSMAAADVLWTGCGYVAHGTVFPDDVTTGFYTKESGGQQILHELTWESTSLATGKNLDFSVISQDRDGCQWYANHFGPSPLSILVDVGEKFSNPESPYPTGGCGDNVVDEEDTALGVLVLSSPTYANDVALAGLTIQQSFEGYVTVFYHQDMPAGYSALPDA